MQALAEPYIDSKCQCLSMLISESPSPVMCWMRLRLIYSPEMLRFGGYIFLYIFRTFVEPKWTVKISNYIIGACKCVYCEQRLIYLQQQLLWVKPVTQNICTHYIIIYYYDCTNHFKTHLFKILFVWTYPFFGTSIRLTDSAVNYGVVIKFTVVVGVRIVIVINLLM